MSSNGAKSEFSSALAPDSASSTDGMTRSMMAVTYFQDAKAEHDALDFSDEPKRVEFHLKWAARCHDFAVDHGGLYIKAAQFISSLQGGAGEAGVPRQYVDALRPLTDRVPPRPFSAVKEVAEEELGAPMASLVESIEEEPIAAASLAQVHRAIVPPRSKGEAPMRVAFKLQYPTLREQIATDFEVLKMMQTMVTTQYDFTWLLDDLQKYVTSELDFRTEAKNCKAACDALESLSPGVLVPPLVPQLCSERTMATEFVDGLTRLDRPSELAALKLNPKELGGLVASAFSELALVNGLVHGDPHSGNVYARVRPVTKGSSAAAASDSPFVPAQLVLLDHGLYHRLTDADRLRMCDLILACASPWPSRRTVRKTSEAFAGALAPLFPTLISPAFALATGLSVKQLRAAADGRLPAGTSLEDVWQTLVEMHNGESDVIGLLHSMGYVRGLQNALNYPERKRVEAMASAACRASCAARHTFLVEYRLSLALYLTALRVKLLFWLLYLGTYVLPLLERVFGTSRVTPL